MKNFKKSNLSCKIMSALVLSIIVLSPTIGSRASAMQQAPEDQFNNSLNTVPCNSLSKKRMLEMLPELWKKFQITGNAAKDIVATASRQQVVNLRTTYNYNLIEAAFRSAKSATNDLIYGVAEEAAGNDAVYTYDTIYNILDSTGVDWNVSHDMAFDASAITWNIGFSDAWKPHGVIYNVVKNYDKKYFNNLVRTLQEQTVILETIVKEYSNC